MKKGTQSTEETEKIIPLSGDELNYDDFMDWSFATPEERDFALQEYSCFVARLTGGVQE